MDRVVFTVAFGKPKFAEMAMGLARSLSFIGDTTPRAIMTDIEGYDWERYFDVVVRRSIPREEIAWSKLAGVEVTGAKRVLYVDSDMLAFKRLDPVFKAFEGAPFGVQGNWLKEGFWYDKDLALLCKEVGVEAIPKFNGGLLYYEAGEGVDRIRDLAKQFVRDYDKFGFRKHRVPDEPCMSLAMATSGIGRLVHDSANFHNSAVGVVGKFHLNVLRNECRYVCRRRTLEYVEPYLFHAHFWAKFRIYWQQLEMLKAMERIEDRTDVHYRQPFHSLKRSVQKRYMKTFWEVDA